MDVYSCSGTLITGVSDNVEEMIGLLGIIGTSKGGQFYKRQKTNDKRLTTPYKAFLEMDFSKTHATYERHISPLFASVRLCSLLFALFASVRLCSPLFASVRFCSPCSLLFPLQLTTDAICCEGGLPPPAR